MSSLWLLLNPYKERKRNKKQEIRSKKYLYCRLDLKALNNCCRWNVRGCPLDVFTTFLEEAALCKNAFNYFELILNIESTTVYF